MDVARAYALLLRIDDGEPMHGRASCMLLERGLIERRLARFRDGYWHQRLQWRYELTRAGRELVALVELGLMYNVGRRVAA